MGVGQLGIDDIIVCGHTGCGGIAALLEPGGMASDQHLGRWMEFTKPAHQLIAAAGVPEEERLTATIKAHVQFQLDNLMTYPIVRDGVAAGRLNVHGWSTICTRANSRLTTRMRAAGAGCSSEPKPALGGSRLPLGGGGRQPARRMR